MITFLIPLIALCGRILFLGYERIVFKQASQDHDDVVATSLLFGLSGLIQIPFLFLFPWTIRDFLPVLGSALIYSIAFVLYVHVLSHYEISLVSPFYNFNVFFILLLSVIFLGESFTILKGVGIILLFVGTRFLDPNSEFLPALKHIFTHRGILLMILVSGLMAGGRILDRYFIQETHPAIYALILNIYISLFVYIFSLFQRKSGLYLPLLRTRWKYLLGGAIANAFSYLLLLVAFLYLDVSIVEPLSMLSTFITLILSKILLHESVRQRILGTVIMLLGTICLVLNLFV